MKNESEKRRPFSRLAVIEPCHFLVGACHCIQHEEIFKVSDITW